MQVKRVMFQFRTDLVWFPALSPPPYWISNSRGSNFVIVHLNGSYLPIEKATFVSVLTWHIWASSSGDKIRTRDKQVA